MSDNGDIAKLMKEYLECQANLDRIDNLINTRALLESENALGLEVNCNDFYLFDKRPESDSGCYYLVPGDRRLVEKFISASLHVVFSYIRAERLQELKESAQRVRKTAQDIITITEEYK